MVPVKICLIGVTHPSSNPRLLREADTLAKAGHEVRVCCRQIDPVMTAHDGRLLQSRSWRFQPVDLMRNGSSHRRWLLESASSKLLAGAFGAGIRTVAVGSRGYLRGFKPLQKLAESEPADWFIAHTQAVLPVAAAAARRWHSRLGFDCEDLLAELGADPAAIVRLIEKEYLPKCDYVSVPSEVIAKCLGEQYGIKAPVVLYNVFPSSLAAGMKPPSERRAVGPLRLHWFGQTIGEGRGIEESIEAVKLLHGRVELHLRGRIGEGYRSSLEGRVRECGPRVKLVIHPLVGHEELIKTMADFDIGLALERPGNSGYARTVTNKLFSYLLAGLAMAATDTPGQREVMQQIPHAGFLYPAGIPQLLTERLQHWTDNRSALQTARQAAWDAARRRFCWDIEEQNFLKVLGLADSNRHVETAAGVAS